MEHSHQVKFTTTSSFELEPSEVKQLYIYLALFQYRYLRKPNYNERLLIEHLEKDIRMYLVEMQKQCEREPNNLALNRTRTFLDVNYRAIKRVAEECKEESRTL